MKIAVVEDYGNVFRSVADFAKLEGHAVEVHSEAETDVDALAAKIADAEIVVLTQQRTRFPRKLIEKLPRLRFISQTGRNLGHLDVDACTERGIVVSAIGGGYPHATVELTWGLIIAALRHIPYEVQRLRDGHWQSTVGTRLYESTLGIYAYGRIGKLVANVGAAFGMRVLCWGREGSTERARADGWEVARTREQFFFDSDVVTLHLPLRDDSTRGIVTARDLALMKPTAVLVNTSRAGIIEEGALVQALRNGRPGFAGVDVFDNEPVVGASDPLLALPNAICTPHLGYVTRETIEHHYCDAIEQILAYVAGKPINVVNPSRETP
jgi:D-3-phosphoglycerate dehydrogenase